MTSADSLVCIPAPESFLIRATTTTQYVVAGFFSLPVLPTFKLSAAPIPHNLLAKTFIILINHVADMNNNVIFNNQ